jgi:amino acid permease
MIGLVPCGWVELTVLTEGEAAIACSSIPAKMKTIIVIINAFFIMPTTSSS